MLGRRRRRWPNITTPYRQRPLFSVTGIVAGVSMSAQHQPFQQEIQHINISRWKIFLKLFSLLIHLNTPEFEDTLMLNISESE